VTRELLTEAINGDSALAVVLDDLVGRSLGTSALDHGVAVTLKGESILADIDPPDVPVGLLDYVWLPMEKMTILNGASSLAVDTLDLILANDGVLESATVLDGEDGVLVSSLDLASARNTTAVGLHASIEDTRDNLRRLQGNRALGSRDWKGSTLVQAEELSGSVGSRASGDGRDKRSDGGSDGDGELHVVGCRLEKRCLVKVCVKNGMLYKSVSSKVGCFKQTEGVERRMNVIG
jgi:hypothetical protein